jgi:hypothetical protein
MRDHASPSCGFSRKQPRVPIGFAKPSMRMRQADECETPGPKESIPSQLKNNFSNPQKSPPQRWSEVAMRPAEDAVSEMSPSRLAAGRVSRPVRRYTDTLKVARFQPSKEVCSTTTLFRSVPCALTSQRKLARGTSLAIDLQELTARQRHPLLAREATRKSSRIEGPPPLSTMSSKQRSIRSSTVLACSSPSMVRNVQSGSKPDFRPSLPHDRRVFQDCTSIPRLSKRLVDLAEIRELSLPQGEARNHARQAFQADLSRSYRMSLIGRLREPRHSVSTKVHGTLDFPPPRSERPRTISIAPGIEVPPPKLVQGATKPRGTATRPRKKLINYPPDQQHPAAPAYPIRETPSWTRPDICTPPPKPKAELKRKKQRFLDWCQPSAARPTRKYHQRRLINYASRSGLEPTYHAPVATKLVSDPFVARRRSRFALNLQRNKALVTKRQSLIGSKRKHLLVGRRLTRNPVARAQLREWRVSHGMSASMSAVSWRQWAVCFVRRLEPGCRCARQGR